LSYTKRDSKATEANYGMIKEFNVDYSTEVLININKFAAPDVLRVRGYKLINQKQKKKKLKQTNPSPVRLQNP